MGTYNPYFALFSAHQHLLLEVIQEEMDAPGISQKDSAVLICLYNKIFTQSGTFNLNTPDTKLIKDAVLRKIANLSRINFVPKNAVDGDQLDSHKKQIEALHEMLGAIEHQKIPYGRAHPELPHRADAG
jgi:exopolyphosphatase/pppGpp-phosphohydrolase